MVVASYGQCPYCHERRANAEALKFLCLLEYEGKVIFFRPAVHFFVISRAPLLHPRRLQQKNTKQLSFICVNRNNDR